LTVETGAREVVEVEEIVTSVVVPDDEATPDGSSEDEGTEYKISQRLNKNAHA